MVPESTRSASTLGTTRDNGIIDTRGWRLIVPGVLVATALFVILLWPTLITNYHGLPPARARIVASLEMLISFSVCALGIMFFHALLSTRSAQQSIESPGMRTTGRRRFLALAIGAALAVALNGLLRRLYRIGAFSYNSRQVQRAWRAKDHTDSSAR